MKNIVLIFCLASIFAFSGSCQYKNQVPVTVKNNRTYVTIQIGKMLIPDILLDTGFAYDGLMIFNQAYKDSLDLTKAVDVQIGGAGSGDATKAIMIDSASFSLGDTKMINQPVIILRGNPGFGSNGIIGYSIFGHYITEFDYDKNTMSLYNSDKITMDGSWKEIPLYLRTIISHGWMLLW